MYFSYCNTEFSLSRSRRRRFAAGLDKALEHALLEDGTSLYPPYVVVCHDTRYKENSLTGLVRILGLGKFGEFATITFEMLTNQLIGELRRKSIDIGDEHVFAEYGGVKAVGVLRTYDATNPGRRSLKYRMEILHPETDLDIDAADIAACARSRYGI